MRTKIVFPVIVAVGALLLTGCVNNSTPAASGGGSVTSVKKDATAAALLPPKVASTGKLVIGTDPTYAPNEFKDEAGQPIGWGIELAKGIAGKLGLTAEYQVAKFDNIIPSIVGGKVDIGVASFTDNAEREKQVDFVNYYNTGEQYGSAAGSTFDPNNACGFKVAVQATTLEDTEEVPVKSAACVAAGKPAIIKLKYDTQDAATTAVTLGQADAMVADLPVTLYAVKQLTGKLQAAGTPFGSAPYGIAIGKKSGLGKAIQAAVQSMIDDGSYGKILAKWGVADGAITKATINAATKG